MAGTGMRRLFFLKYLISGDPLVYDRWVFIRRYLPRVNGKERLIDIGCGSGAFTLGAALLGYLAHGLSWDEVNQSKALKRAHRLGVDQSVEFPIGDARRLSGLGFKEQSYDYALCMENAEHIIDDVKLMRDIAALLRPGGVLIFSAPNRFYRAITSEDNGPFHQVETGWHVRRGYSVSEVRELMEACALSVEWIGYCSGFLSQKVAWLMRWISPKFGYRLVWLLVLPLRPLVLIFDRLTLPFWPAYSITAVAVKPRA